MVLVVDKPKKAGCPYCYDGHLVKHERGLTYCNRCQKAVVIYLDTEDENY